MILSLGVPVKVHYFADSNGYRPKQEILYRERVVPARAAPVVHYGNFPPTFLFSYKMCSKMKALRKNTTVKIIKSKKTRQNLNSKSTERVYFGNSNPKT